jgi:hypothetical protein
MAILKKTIPHNVATMWPFFFKKKKKKKRKQSLRTCRKGVLFFCRQGCEISRKQREVRLELLESRQNAAQFKRTHTKQQDPKH